MTKTLMQREIESSKEFMLDTITIDYKNKKIKIAEISHRNVALVEAFIHNDSDYHVKKDLDEKDSEFWFAKLKEVLLNKQKVSKETYYDYIFNAVKRVDASNSTHLNADKVGREEISKRIAKIPKRKLIKYLKYPLKTNYKLFGIIKERTSATVKPRENPSFASKFCTEACFNFFKGTEYEDNYSKFDNIVRKALPYYAAYYNIDIRDLNLSEYYDYQYLIDTIRSKAEIEISRYAFDHLLWYYFKARM